MEVTSWLHWRQWCPSSCGGGTPSTLPSRTRQHTSQVRGTRECGERRGGDKSRHDRDSTSSHWSFAHFLHCFQHFHPLLLCTPADSIDSLLQIHDPALYQHFEAVGVPAGPLGWTLINSMFSEVLGERRHHSPVSPVCSVGIVLRNSLICLNGGMAFHKYWEHEKGEISNISLCFTCFLCHSHPYRCFITAWYPNLKCILLTHHIHRNIPLSLSGKDDWAIWMDTLFTNFNRWDSLHSVMRCLYSILFIALR